LRRARVHGTLAAMRSVLPGLLLVLLVASTSGCDRRRGTVGPRDGGTPMTDGGTAGTDGGLPMTDGGVPGTDGGVPGTDGGVPGTDGGPPAFDVTGDWTGTWSSLGVSGTATATLAQTGSMVIGVITFEGSPCGATSTLDGTVGGTAFTGELTFDDGSLADVDATASASSIAGSAAITTGSCAGITATFTLARAP
jgi:hypothetical protein